MTHFYKGLGLSVNLLFFTNKQPTKKQTFFLENKIRDDWTFEIGFNSIDDKIEQSKI